jgi:hypothetical protein
MVLGSTQPLTEMSTRCISWCKGSRCLSLTTLPPSCAVVVKSGNFNFEVWHPRCVLLTVTRCNKNYISVVFTTVYLCHLLYIVGTLTSWNPLGHSRPVTGLLLLKWQNVVYECTLLLIIDITDVRCFMHIVNSNVPVNFNQECCSITLAIIVYIQFTLPIFIFSCCCFVFLTLYM